VACTVDACNENADRVDHAPDNARCADANVCDGNEVCDAVAGCREGNRAPDGTPCGNPGNVCTAGICGPGGGGGRDGTYAIAPPFDFQCFFGNLRVNFRNLIFTTAGGALTVEGAPTLMTQRPPPAGNAFSVAGAVLGVPPFNCDEFYSLTGTFSDDTHWCGTFVIDFAGPACGIAACSRASFDICGTRAP
jgi:hypothetical protein